jgi:hypothetical protein
MRLTRKSGDQRHHAQLHLRGVTTAAHKFDVLDQAFGMRLFRHGVLRSFTDRAAGDLADAGPVVV